MSDLGNTVMTHPAAIRSAGVSLDRASLMSIARERAFDPSAFDSAEPFFFPAEISSNRLDAYFTRMQPSSLKNYATEADSGVSFMLAHQTRGAMPVGSSLTGTYIGAQGNGVASVRANFFTLPGFEGPIISTDQLIRGISTGMYRDVSIGFFGGRAICSICNRDIFDWYSDCPHIPGIEYDNTDTKGNVLGRDLCTADIEDAHLAEVSGVYDGATPGAAIIKASMVADAGRMSKDVARMLEQRYRHLDRSVLRSIHDAGLARIAGTDLAGNEENQSAKAEEGREGMANENQETRTDGENGTAATEPAAPAAPAANEGDRTLELVRGAVTEAGITVEVTNAEVGIRALVAECNRLRPLADDGREYRTDLLDTAVREAVRAGFSEETYRGILSRASIPELRQALKDFGVKGDAMFAGGRQSLDEGEESPEEQPSTRRRTPKEAFVS